ncbi:MAG: zinc-binding dehydrogenase [Schleiferilactobacillus perolens]|uniref:alcohol dehydrogenase catalytic domain-containing protein n=1 Tax=Schleiferilactobacillus perolens TaxID=100468 RepID=UPI0039E872C0
MKAIVVSHPGGPEVLEYVDVPTPSVKPGWTRVKVRGFGINHSEIFTREGESPSVKFPRILGIEAVGTIDETTAPDKFHPGQKVISIMGEMGRAFDGGYAEYVLLPNDQIYPIETTLSWADLAAVPETYYTAWGIVRSLQIRTGDRILIRAATSGVGVAVYKLIQALTRHNDIVGTTRSVKKRPLLEKVGMNQIIVTPDALKLPADTKPFDKIVDLIGPASTRDSLRHLNQFGIANVTGELGGVWYLQDFDPITDIPNDRYLTGFSSADVSARVLQEMITFIEERHIDVSPIKTFPLSETRQAHEFLASSHGFGKVVVLPN